MVKDYSHSERGNPLPPKHGLLFPIISKGFFYNILYYMQHPTDRIAITMAFVIQVMEHSEFRD